MRAQAHRPRALRVRGTGLGASCHTDTLAHAQMLSSEWTFSIMKIIKGIDLQQLSRSIEISSAIVRATCGIVNNATWLILLDAHDQAKKLPDYKQQRVKREFKRMFELWRKYERNLFHSSTNRFFHVADMDEKTRRRYGNITDREYFEFWQGQGYKAYQLHKPLITSLWNKYRLVLINHNIGDENELAWVLTAQAALAICDDTWRGMMQEVDVTFHVPLHIAKGVFKGFHPEGVKKAWDRAIMSLAPQLNFELDKVEERNVQMGVDQLFNTLTEPSNIFMITSGAVEDYAEVFRTPGMAKKTAREFNEMSKNISNYD